MSVIIKGVEMPKVCDDCGWYYWSNIDKEYKCRLTDTGLQVKNVMLERGVDCPLAEIPKGVDLVDRNYLLSEYDKQHKGTPGGARKIMKEAPTIFEEGER